jgi:hypothetical protein
VANFPSSVVLPVDDIGLADHLIEPVLDGGVLAPPLLRALVGDAVHRNLVTLSMLYIQIIGREKNTVHVL